MRNLLLTFVEVMRIDELGCVLLMHDFVYMSDVRRLIPAAYVNIFRHWQPEMSLPHYIFTIID